MLIGFIWWLIRVCWRHLGACGSVFAESLSGEIEVSRVELVWFMNLSNDERDSGAKATAVPSSTLKPATKHRDGCISPGEGNGTYAGTESAALQACSGNLAHKSQLGTKTLILRGDALRQRRRCFLGASTASDIVHSQIKMHQIRSLGPFPASSF